MPSSSAAGSRAQNYDASLTAASGRVTNQWTPSPAAALARDPARGVPTMLVSPSTALPVAGSTAEEAARFHLMNVRGAYKVPRAALTSARLRFVHDLGRGGIVVSLRQMLAGVEVFHGDVKVLLDRGDHRLLAIAGAPHPAAVPGNKQRFALGKTQAITVALADLYGSSRAAVRLVANGERRGGWEHFAAESGGLKFREPARVKPVYFPIGDSLVPGWFTEVQVRRASGEVDAFQHVIAANDGRLLYRRDLTAYESNNYRVWADADGDHRPADGPNEDWTPHPTGLPDVGPTGYAPTSLIAVDGLNTNPENQPDPWLPPGGTETKGNNVDAYVDWTAPDGLNVDMNEFRANVSGPNAFDYTYDPLLEPLANTTQSKASIVQLFYDINWLHDWWYDSGFVEATGVAQASNYGRGGVEGDDMRAEAQDGAITGSRNNANMSTPADGMRPRMQMFLWTAVATTKLDVLPVSPNTEAKAAAFGPKNYDVQADVVLAVDGVGPNVNDGCTALTNAAEVAGKIALIDRGNCTFEVKVSSAQAAGAIGVIVANNVEATVLPGMGADNATPDPIIPSVGVTQNAGIAIKAGLQNGPQNAHMTSSAGTERDGTIDNMIVAHEFGHYLHHRLQECGTKQCGAQSEGWGDFNAAMMALRDGDDLDGVFCDSTYASGDKTGYFGIRRVPYSTDFTKNAVTFKHMTDGVALPNTHPVAPNGIVNSEVHNSGEVWAEAMWEAYISLQKANQGSQTFAQINRAMSDYVVGGLMMTPIDPTFTETRDGILQVARAASADDFLTMANAFARRGMGSCAVSPPKDSTDFSGIVEDFELHGNGVMTGIPTVSDDILSCDDDGVVDVGEVGSVRVKVTNIGALSLPEGSTVEILDPPATLEFPDGLLAPVDALAPYQTIEAVIPVTVVEPQADNFQEVLKIRLNTPAGCALTAETALPVEFNADLSPQSSSFDDVEPTVSAWVAGGALADSVWSRMPATTDGWFWHGADIGTMSDTWLESPTVTVSDDQPLTIVFDHRFTFEFSDNTNWDGGLVELSEDAGMTWKDVTEYGAAPKYNGTINSAVNPINGKTAYVHRNAAYPDRETETLEFMGLAEQDVKFRFRIGTDGAAGDIGWDIDNIEFKGIKNLPFSSWIPDGTMCVEDTTTGEDTTSTDTDDTSTGGDTSTDGSTTSGDASSSGGEDSSSGGTTEGIGDTSASSSSGVGTLETSAGTDTGDDTSTGGGDGGSSPLPTTSGGPNPSGDDDDDDDDSSASASETETDPNQEVDDEGCGCGVDEKNGWGWQVAPWLALLGLRRRRRHM